MSSESAQHLYQHQQKLREAHEAKLAEEKANKDHMARQLESQLRQAAQMKLRMQKNKDEVLTLQHAIEEIQASRKKAVQIISRTVKQEGTDNEFSKKTVLVKQISNEIKQQKTEQSHIASNCQANQSLELTKKGQINRNHQQRLLQLVAQLAQQQQAKKHQLKNKHSEYQHCLATLQQLQLSIKKSQAQLKALEQQTSKAFALREDRISHLPPLQPDEFLYISNEGLDSLLQNYDSNCPEKGYCWTSDYRTELPIFVKKTGLLSFTPKTFVDVWDNTLAKYGSRPALTFETSDDVWKTLTYKEYYQECCRFGKALIAHGITQFTPVMLLGLNAVQEHIAIFGALFARYISVGIYTTSDPETCKYIANHCEGELVLVEDRNQLRKYYGIIDECPRIKYFVIFKEPAPKDLPESLKGKVLSWNDFMQKAQIYHPKSVSKTLEHRMRKQKPGHCITFVYTSGTTGQPKAVMVNHDSYLTAAILLGNKVVEPKFFDGNGRVLSYLTLSHIAGQLISQIMSCIYGLETYIARPSVMKGDLIKYLRIARPTYFLGVPRIWEKIKDKITQDILRKTDPERKLIEWAMSIGTEGTFAEIHNKPTPKGWNIAKKVFDEMKESVGLDKCEYFLIGTAPMPHNLRQFFLKVNIIFGNSYGMSETTGPHTCTEHKAWTADNKLYLEEAGSVYAGVDMVIDNPDEEGKGEICMRGRNRFMGYFRNDDANKSTVDSKGFVHSGDEGCLSDKNVLFITGRLKELIVTAAGYNVPPLIVEAQILKALPIVSHAVAIGDGKKYLTCLLCLKTNAPSHPNVLAKEVVEVIRKVNSPASTVQEAASCPAVNELVRKGIEEANKKARSNVQRVRKFKILPLEFSLDLGVLTPTMKLKRKVVHEMFKTEIESMYLDSKL